VDVQADIKLHAKDVVDDLCNDDVFLEWAHQVIMTDHGITREDMQDEEGAAYKLYYESLSALTARVLAEAICQLRHWPNKE